MHRYRLQPTLSRLALLVGVCGVCAAAHAQVNRDTDELEGVEIDEKLDAQLPLDLWFKDSTGKDVQLRQYFHQDRPVLLTFNYFRCTMLCTLQLNGLVDALKEIDLEPGKDFEIITVSFDPMEKPPMAAGKKKTYVTEYGKASATRGWHFLTGSSKSIKTLTDSVGFRYKWLEDQGEWSHRAALILCTPEGHTSRYLGGVMYDPPTLRLSMIEASQGKIGSLFDQVFLTCFHYAAHEGRYTPSVMGFMRLGGVIVLVLLGGMLLTFWRIEVLRRKRLSQATIKDDDAPAVAH